MTSFIYGTEISLALEMLIEEAEEKLWFISPYIKLHDRIKSELKNRKDDVILQIVILFGKNEYNLEKSISPEDINFLKEFPNVMICYEKNLHAKYYSSDKFSLITSMNLHEYSQNSNIEVAIVLNPRGRVSKLKNYILSSEDLEEQSCLYFEEIIKNSEIIFKKTPQFESGFLNLSKKYTYSEVEVDRLLEFYQAPNSDYNNLRQNSFSSQERKFYKNSNTKIGFCIRTGREIPFNPARPYSYEAYQIWSQFENPDYPERYCHSSGKESHGKTSMKNPILK